LVDVLAIGGVGVEALLALRLRALARGADVHHPERAVHALRHCERAGVQRVHELLVVLGDHAGAAAVRAVELDQLDVEPGRHGGHRAVELRGEAARHAAGPIRDLDAQASWPPSAIAPSSSPPDSPTMYMFSS